MRRARLPGRTLALLALALACGCTVVRRSERNAPGDVDLRTPPARIDQPLAEPPRDPGDHLFLFEVAPQALAGVGFGGPNGGGTRFSPSLGVEASLVYGQDESSLTAAPFPFEVPERAIGLAAGWVGVAESGQPEHASLELQLRRRPLSLGAGWVYEPSSGRSGAQATFTAGPLVLRGVALSGRGGSIQLGVELPLAFAFLWSR